MNLFSLYRVELHRLALSKLTWVVAALSLCAPLLGYSLLILTNDLAVSMSVKYIANPVLAGTVCGAVLWGLLTIREADRVYRAKTDVLTDYIASPMIMSVAKTTAMTTLAIVNMLMCVVIYLPYTAMKMEYLFSSAFYFLNFFILMLPTWIISILFATAFYQITRRVELTGLLYAGFAGFSFGGYAKDDYFLRWLNPLITTYSDGFVSLWPLRINLYTRLIWLAFALGLWTLSLLCIRRYERGLVFSIIKHLKKMHIPAVAVMFVTVGVYLWNVQPFVDNGPYEWVEDERPYMLPASSCHLSVKADPVTGKISGVAEYELKSVAYEESKKEDEIWLNPGYDVTRITYGDKEIEFRTEKNSDKNGHRSTFFSLPQTRGQTLTIEYGGFPKMARMFYPWSVHNSVDKEYISLVNYAFVPDGYYVFGDTTLEVTLPNNMISFADHKIMTDFTDNNDGTKTWRGVYDYLGFTLYAGEYIIEPFSAAGTDIDFAYGRKYEKVIKDYDITSAIASVFDYATDCYGPTIYNDGSRLLLIVKSSMAGGGWASSGYSECFDTMMSPETLRDTDTGSDGFECSIHEMLHQWWGDFGLNCADDGLWSAEGLTVYSTYRVVKELYGKLYAEQNYINQWEAAVTAQDREFYYRHPEYLEKLPEKYQGALNQSFSAINKYSRMPLMIYKAQQLVGGEEKMDEILRSMFENKENYYETHFTYQDFLYACGLTKEDLEIG